MGADESSQPLKYKTWELKVYIHCEACKKKVKKVLQSIDGVFTTTVDSVQHKVTVTGDVDADTLIKKLQKIRKYVELWPQKEDTSGKKGSGKGGDASGKKGKDPAEKNENGGKKSNEAKDGAAKEAAGEQPGDGDAKKQGTDEKPAGEAPSPDGGKAKEGNGGASGGGGKKKGKKGNGNGNGGGGGGGSGGENPGDGSAGNAGNGQPPAAVGAPAAVAQVGCATASHLQMIQPFGPSVCNGWGGQWTTPAVHYSTATPGLSYGGSYAPPPYVDASFMVPYGSGGVVRYVPPGSYLRRQDDYDIYYEENTSVCSVM